MSDAFLPMDARPVLFEGRDRFLPALGVAILVEAALIAAFMHVPPPAAAVRAAHPRTVKIQMLAPPAPKPKPLPPPPKPVPPPPQPVPKPPPPPPPNPVARPLPRPVPIRKPRPLPHPAHRVIHRPMRKPRPLPPVEHPLQPPAPPAPAVSAAEQANAAELYAATLRGRVQANTQVPEAVAMMHLSGVATLRIELAPSGQLMAVSILRSSGIPPIDRAAMASVRATSFPPFPAKMPRHPMIFTLRVRLNGG
jgi:protein TonB